MGDKKGFGLIMLISIFMIVGVISIIGFQNAYAGFDTTPPDLTIPPDVFVEIGSSIDPLVTGMATATDNVDPSPVISFSDDDSGLDSFGLGDIHRFWSAVDASGNTITKTQIITIVDTTPPDLTIPPDVFVEIGSSIDPLVTGMATATDNVDPSPVISFSDDDSGLDSFGLGDIHRFWSAVDASGNTITKTQIITVIALEVEIDIKPNSDPNSINQKSKGLLAVAIFGSPDFDVTQIDTTTVDFDILDVNGSTIATKCNIEDVDGDGIDDMVCFFKIKDIDHKCTAEFVVGQIQGQLDGTPFRGLDDVRWVNCKHFEP